MTVSSQPSEQNLQLSVGVDLTVFAQWWHTPGTSHVHATGQAVWGFDYGDWTPDRAIEACVLSCLNRLTAYSLQPALIDTHSCLYLSTQQVCCGTAYIY
jgi:hypothetical protein